MKKRAVLLINVGTPNSPKVTDVRKYLSQFLNDKRVITLPYIARKVLVNGIIVPFRSKKSSKLYKKLWTEKGSPLLVNSLSLVSKLNNALGENSKAFLGMRYGNPSIRHALTAISEYNPDEIVVLPLYPQYASSTTESSFDIVNKVFKTWKKLPEIKYINQFYNHPRFIDVYVKRIFQYHPLRYDHILFSYHGLPLSHIESIHPKVGLLNCSCEKEMPKHGKLCYKATCYETTRLLVNKLRLKKEQYSVGFQSRLSKKWITPFADGLIKSLANKGIKKLLVVAPSFVTDCLETIIEIEQEYKDIFIRCGGSQLSLVHSLNDSDKWAEALVEISSN